MNNEIIIRVGSFLVVFILIALWEIMARRRTLTTSRKVRWFNNLGLTLINTIVVRLVLPLVGDPGRQPIKYQ